MSGVAVGCFAIILPLLLWKVVVLHFRVEALGKENAALRESVTAALPEALDHFDAVLQQRLGVLEKSKGTGDAAKGLRALKSPPRSAKKKTDEVLASREMSPWKACDEGWHRRSGARCHAAVAFKPGGDPFWTLHVGRGDESGFCDKGTPLDAVKRLVDKRMAEHIQRDDRKLGL